MDNVKSKILGCEKHKFYIFLQLWCLDQLACIWTNSTGHLSPPTSNKYQVTLSTNTKTYENWQLNLRPSVVSVTFSILQAVVNDSQKMRKNDNTWG